MKLFRFIWILFAACLSSCSVVQYVNVPVDYAPKLGFDRDSTTIVVINHYLPDSTQVRSPRIRSIFKAGVFTAINNLSMQLHMLPGVNVVRLVDSVKFTTNTDSVKMLVKKYNAQYVLSFDDFRAETVWQNTVYEGVPTAYRAAIIKTDLTLYQANGIYFKKLKGVGEVYDENSYGTSISLANTRPFFEAIKNSSLDALKDYLPYTDYHDRPLYTDNENLQASVAQIKTGRFDMAFKLLNPLIDGADTKLASKAAYNLAVVYEAQGDIETALETAKLSNQKQPNNFAKVLIADLIKE